MGEPLEAAEMPLRHGIDSRRSDHQLGAGLAWPGGGSLAPAHPQFFLIVEVTD
jgi:hypothetical protein